MVMPHTPQSVGGFIPSDLFNAGNRRQPAGLNRVDPRFTARAVGSTPEGDIVWWRAIVEDSRGGLNSVHGRFDDTFDRMRSGDADGRFYRHMILPHLTTIQTSPVPGSTGITGMHSVMFNDKLHVSLGSTTPATIDTVTAAVQQAAAQVYRITGWHGTTPPEVGTAATGTSDVPNPPSATASWGSLSNLWLAAFAADANAVTATNSPPTDYSNGTITQSDATSAGGVILGSARRELSIGSENPGTFDIGTASEEWVAQTVVVRPSATSATNPVAWDEEGTNFSTSSTTHNVVMPASVAAGELLIVFMHYYGVLTTGNVPSGWTRVDGATFGTNVSQGACVFVKVADGTEDGTSVNFSTATSCRAAGMAFTVQNWYGTLAGIEISTWHETTGAPNPPSITQSWGTSAPTLYIAFGCQAIDTYDGTNSTDIVDGPAGYATLRGYTVNNAGAGVSFSGQADSRVVTASSENPGTYTINSVLNDASMGVVVAIRGAATTSDYPTVASITETRFPTDATAHLVTLPPSNAGDLLVMFFASDADSAVTTPTGWTQLHTTANGTAARLSTYYKISTGGDSGQGALFAEASVTDPELELTQYNPGDSVTGLHTVVLGGATQPLRLLVSRLTTAMQLVGEDYIVAGSLHTDTDPGWGAIQTFTNDDLILLYANGAIRGLAKTAAITDQPTVLLTGVPDGGCALGMVRLGNAPFRPTWLWPFESVSASMLAFGSERPGRVVQTNAEGTDFQEIPMGIRNVYNAVAVGDYAVAAHDKKRLMLYDGTGAARDLGWLAERDNLDADTTMELRGMFSNGEELWVEVYETSGSNVYRHWEVYNINTNAWHQVSRNQSIGTTDDTNGIVFAAGSAPFSTSTRYTVSYTGTAWHRIYVPYPGYNPAHDLGSHHEYEATADASFPLWEFAGLEGYPKIVSQIIFLGEVDDGGTDGDDAYVEVTAGNMTVRFATGLDGRAQAVDFRDTGDLFYRLDMSITMGRNSGTTTATPNALPMVIEGFTFVPKQYAPPWLNDVR